MPISFPSEFESTKTRKLKILPGLRWSGHIKVIGRKDGNYVVDFDAINPASVYERHVMDRAVLTPKQLKDWTGIDAAEKGPVTNT